MTLSNPQGNRIKISEPISEEEEARHQKHSDELAARCQVIFERIRPNLIDNYHNWYIAIDPDTEEYIIDPTFDGIIKKVTDAYGYANDPKLTMYKLNDTGYCGRI
ncbi:hypothetical protein CAL7716_056550 [Calothrix sp. PCC 7716]|nr:hypothetical protein CAL7716_056550 [Calothrix sp. PCC 7716]